MGFNHSQSHYLSRNNMTGLMDCRKLQRPNGCIQGYCLVRICKVTEHAVKQRRYNQCKFIHNLDSTNKQRIVDDY